MQLPGARRRHPAWQRASRCDPGRLQRPAGLVPASHRVRPRCLPGVLGRARSRARLRLRKRARDDRALAASWRSPPARALLPRDMRRAAAGRGHFRHTTEPPPSGSRTSLSIALPAGQPALLRDPRLSGGEPSAWGATSHIQKTGQMNDATLRGARSTLRGEKRYLRKDGTVSGSRIRSRSSATRPANRSTRSPCTTTSARAGQWRTLRNSEAHFAGGDSANEGSSLTGTSISSPAMPPPAPSSGCSGRAVGRPASPPVRGRLALPPKSDRREHGTARRSPAWSWTRAPNGNVTWLGGTPETR